MAPPLASILTKSSNILLKNHPDEHPDFVATSGKPRPFPLATLGSPQASFSLPHSTFLHPSPPTPILFWSPQTLGGSEKIPSGNSRMRVPRPARHCGLPPRKLRTFLLPVQVCSDPGNPHHANELRRRSHLNLRNFLPERLHGCDSGCADHRSRRPADQGSSLLGGWP